MTSHTANASEEERDRGILVGSMEKNAHESLHVRLTSYRNYMLVDLRLFYQLGNSQEKRASKKGFSIRRDKISDLIELLLTAQAMDQTQPNAEEFVDTARHLNETPL